MWSFVHSPMRRALGSLLLLGAILVAVGCERKVPEGTVSGKVTYKGKAVTTGSVNFTDSQKGIGSQGPLDGSGNYTIPDPLQVGTYKVFIQPPIPEQLPPGTPPKKPGVAIPSKYQDAGKSTLSFEVKAGKNDINIELTD